jgi:DNA repair protein RadC
LIEKRKTSEVLSSDTGIIVVRKIAQKPYNEQPRNLGGLRDSMMNKWSHPGGKLRELGAEALSDAELLAILISTGIKGTPAEKIAEEVVERFGSFSEMANVPLERFLEIKGLSDVKIIRIAAAFEIARRLSRESMEPRPPRFP